MIWQNAEDATADGEATLLEPAIDRPHSVSRFLDGHTPTERAGRKRKHAVGIVDGRVTGKHRAAIRNIDVADDGHGAGAVLKTELSIDFGPVLDAEARLEALAQRSAVRSGRLRPEGRFADVPNTKNAPATGTIPGAGDYGYP